MIYFSLFHIETEVTLAGLLGWGPGGGGKGYIPPLENYWGYGPPVPLSLRLCYFHIFCRRNDASFTNFHSPYSYKAKIIDLYLNHKL